jgi:hypothetical protein
MQKRLAHYHQFNRLPLISLSPLVLYNNKLIGAFKLISAVDQNQFWVVVYFSLTTNYAIWRRKADQSQFIFRPRAPLICLITRPKFLIRPPHSNERQSVVHAN